MAKGRRYMTRYFGRSVEMSKANSSILVYRFPYQNLKSRESSFEIENPFVVYILLGKNNNGKDAIYVGKSKNGLKNRPTAHEDKYSNWTECYILTQFKERTFFNDGTIQYIENALNKRVDSLGVYENTTVNTNTGTANTQDEEDCDEFIEEAIQMLDILGLDLITYEKTEEDSDVVADDVSIGTVPDGIYSLSRKLKRENKVFTAKMQVAGNCFIVLKGSMVCPSETQGLMDYVIIKRKEVEIVDDILKEDVVLDSPSAAGSFVIGGACNGWTNWRCEDGTFIDKYRK